MVYNGIYLVVCLLALISDVQIVYHKDASMCETSLLMSFFRHAKKILHVIEENTTQQQKDIICAYCTFSIVESIVGMQITKYLYRAKFEWPDLSNGPIISFLCYAATPEEAAIIAQEIGTKKAHGMDYIGVERLPLALSPHRLVLPFQRRLWLMSN